MDVFCNRRIQGYHVLQSITQFAWDVSRQDVTLQFLTAVSSYLGLLWWWQMHFILLQVSVPSKRFVVDKWLLWYKIFCFVFGYWSKRTIKWKNSPARDFMYIIKSLYKSVLLRLVYFFVLHIFFSYVFDWVKVSKLYTSGTWMPWCDMFGSLMF